MKKKKEIFKMINGGGGGGILSKSKSKLFPTHKVEQSKSHNL